MSNRLLALLLTTLALATSPRSAHADADANTLATEILNHSHDQSAAWVVTRLMKFDVGTICWARTVDTDEPVIGEAAAIAADLTAYAKQVTGEDWRSIKDPAALGSAMNAFKDKLFITIKIDGDDCERRQLTLWVRYWQAIAKRLIRYPPPSGKAIISLDVSSKVTGFTVAVTGNGTVFTIRAPKIDESHGWEEKLERAFAQQVLGNIADFAYEVENAARDRSAGQIIKSTHTFKVGKRCWAKFVDRDQWVVHAATFVTGDIGDWGKKHYPDEWTAFAQKQDFETFAKRISVTVTVDGDDCDGSTSSPWTTYWKEAMDALSDFPPKAKKIAIKITASSKAKRVTVTTDRTGSTFTITGPTASLPQDATDQIRAAFTKVTADRDSVAAHAKLEATSRAVKAGKNPWPHHGRSMRDNEVRDIPSYDRNRDYSKGAVVSTWMSSNPHSLVYKCKVAECTDSPGISSQWQSVGWANAD